jgi:hypothetical protein
MAPGPAETRRFCVQENETLWECRCPIHDEELLAIIHAFQGWEPELRSASPDAPVKVLTYHKAIGFFTTR